MSGLSASGAGVADTDIDNGDTPATNTDVNLTNIAFTGAAFQTTNPGGPVAGSTTSANGTQIDGAYGTLTIGSDGSYSYALDDGAVDPLDAGDSPTEVFTYTIADGDGGMDTATLTINVNGTNEDPLIAGPGVGVINEIADGAAGETTTVSTVTGSLSFADVDADDSHSVAVTAIASAGGGALGTFSPVLDPANGEIDWTFEVTDGSLDFLAEGETIIQTYTVEVTDSEGGTDTEAVRITLVGANDAPIAIDDSSKVTEAGGVANGTAAINVTGESVFEGYTEVTLSNADLVQGFADYGSDIDHTVDGSGVTSYNPDDPTS